MTKKNIVLTGKPVVCGVEPVALTSQQVPLWTQTRTKFLWEAPGFTHILYKMMCPNVPDRIIFTKDMPTAATDGVYIYANPDWYFKLTLPERVFVLGHEVIHAVLNHPIVFHGWRTRGKVTLANGTVLPYDEGTMQHAADYIINAMLTDSKIGKSPLKDGKPILCDPSLISHKDQLVEAYAKLYKKNPPKGGKSKGNPGVTPGGDGKGGRAGGDGDLDTVLQPGKGEGKTPGQAKASRNEQAWKTAVAAAMASAKARGLLSGSMQDMFGEFLDPKISWDEYIQGWAKKKMGSGSWNFRRPDRRYISRDPMIYAPARQGFGAELVVVAVDTSGSIGPATLDRFFGEMVGVLQDVKPKRVEVIWCDAKVHRIDELEEVSDLYTVREKGAPGRGGTAFEPVFDAIAERGLKPDALVYLTDGMGSFPKEAPSYPVLWGNIYPGSKYPFGDVVDIPM